MPAAGSPTCSHRRWSGSRSASSPRPPPRSAAAGVRSPSAAPALQRSSWRPIVVGGITAWVLISAVLTLKHVVARPGPGDFSDQGRSFPSGPTAAALVCLGTIALLVTYRRAQLRAPLLAGVGGITGLVAGALVYNSY